MKLVSNLLLLCAGALLTLGLVMLYSSSMVQVGSRYLVMQLLWAGVGLVVAIGAACYDYRRLQTLAGPLLLLAIVGLVLVLIPGVGEERYGARRWFDLGFASLQPSEFAKLAVITALAAYAARFPRWTREFWRGLMVPGLALGVVLALLAKEPDYGSTIILGAIGATLFLIAGARWRYVLCLLLVGAVAVGTLLWSNENRRSRLLAFVNPVASRDSFGYQSYQAMLALGSGGVQGVGLGNGRQKHGFVPAHHTDFIFSMIGEELGLVATSGVVLVFLILIICGLTIASRARDQFGLLLGSGLTFLIGLQALVNLGVVTGLLPNKGLPLPFISYGGSNLILMMACIGVLINIARQAEDSLAGPMAETLPGTRVSSDG
jgi:cell division protein FtsW